MLKALYVHFCTSSLIVLACSLASSWDAGDEYLGFALVLYYWC